MFVCLFFLKWMLAPPLYVCGSQRVSQSRNQYKLNSNCKTPGDSVFACNVSLNSTLKHIQILFIKKTSARHINSKFRTLLPSVESLHWNSMEKTAAATLGEPTLAFIRQASLWQGLDLLAHVTGSGLVDTRSPTGGVTWRLARWTRRPLCCRGRGAPPLAWSELLLHIQLFPRLGISRVKSWNRD